MGWIAGQGEEIPFETEGRRASRPCSRQRMMWPFVRSPGSSRDYFAVSAEPRSLDRSGPMGPLRLSAMRQRLAALLLRHADSRYLQP